MANSAISTLLTEAESLYTQAQMYRVEMEKLPPGDPQRAIYEKAILDLLARSKAMSLKVKAAAG